MTELKRFQARVIAETNVNVSITGVGVIIDGETIADLDLAVLNGQTTSADNGYWQAHAGSAWTRVAEFDTSGEMLRGTEFYITEGNSDNAGSTWTFDTLPTITVGTTPLSFKREAYGPGAAIPDSSNFERDPLTNQWGLKDQFTPTGYFSRVQTTTTGLVVDAVVSDTATTFIEGLRLVYDGAAALTVEAGAAYIPGEGDVITLESDASLSGLALTASTWYYVYLYETGGTGAIEVVTQAPESIVYLGGARIKGPDGGPDDSRRYLGAIRCSSTANTMIPFWDVGLLRRWIASPKVAYASGGLRINPGSGAGEAGTDRATTNTTQSLANLVPPTTRIARLGARNLYNTTAGSTWFSSPGDGLNPATGTGQIEVGIVSSNSTRARVTDYIFTDSSQAIHWASDAAAMDVAFAVLGYIEER